VKDPKRHPLIVGSGIAGLYVALRCREMGLRPTIVTQGRLEESNTRYAQGGIAAAVGPDDSPARHFADTVKAGDGLVDRAAARLLANDAPARIAALARYGVPFDTIEGHIALGREAAHSRDRILHAGGDATGLSIEETLKRRVLEGGIDIEERTTLRTLGPGDGVGPVAVVVRAPGGAAVTHEARPVVLATGGAGNLYRQSTNRPFAMGEGIAIAFRTGALVADMEFVQFHPTAFWREGAPRYLITEAIRGEGARLVNDAGERFMLEAHPDAELAPRDVVARAVEGEIARSEHPHVYLDATRIPRDRLFARFPSICRFLTLYGLDPSKDRIPVAPVAHYMIGGIATDLDGRTSIPGLYAAGEVAATGVHGANRLGSNSLLEGLVFGERVALQLRHPTRGGPKRPARTIELSLPPGDGGAEDTATLDMIRTRLWEDVGIVRTPEGLRAALAAMEALGRDVEPSSKGTVPGTVANAALTASLIARAALERTESRGAHYRTDWPRRRKIWERHVGLSARRASRGAR
jgi:L-aspartate oxidase